MGITKTLLTVFVHPDDVDHALYLIGEILTQGGTLYTVLRSEEERISLDIAPPFAVTHRQKQLLFALESPPTAQQIHEFAGEAITGLIYGFLLKGEIDLGESLINNIHGLSSLHPKSEWINGN